MYLTGVGVHYAQLLSGEGNLIEEQSGIINKCDPAEVGDSGAVPVMIIGNNNVFEVRGVKTLLPATRDLEYVL